MKIMKLHKILSNFLFLCFLSLVSANSFAETKWEVATLFFGAHESLEFQSGVEQNLLEISNIRPNHSLVISTYKEDSTNPQIRKQLLSFIKKSFKDPRSKKMLVLYGHGMGPLGLRDFQMSELKSVLDQVKIKFDLLWFDSCFLSNLEFLYELRSKSFYTIASEEAEFSSGLPFESLSELPNQASPLEAATFLSKRFIDSYSYLKKGDQRTSVGTSSATISVIDNSELENFVTSFKIIPKLIRGLSNNDQASLKNRLSKKFSMEKSELIDLGHLLIELRAVVKNPASDLEITKLIRLLNIDSIKKLRTNPRLKIIAPEDKAIMVFGFNNWVNGAQNEYSANSLFKSIIDSNEFIAGPNKDFWPTKRFNSKSMLLSPFAPGINSFDYYFLSADSTKLLSNALSISRSNDVIETELLKKSPGSFLVYSAYTQQVGVKAERYTGVNINLFNTPPSLDYFELEFNQLVDWLRL